MAENKREPRKAIKHWMRSEVFIKDNFTCLICGVKPCIMPKNYDGKKTVYVGETYLVMDHIVPYSKGGKCVKENFQTLCDICNAKKGNKL